MSVLLPVSISSLRKFLSLPALFLLPALSVEGKDYCDTICVESLREIPGNTVTPSQMYNRLAGFASKVEYEMIAYRSQTTDGSYFMQMPLKDNGGVVSILNPQALRLKSITLLEAYGVGKEFTHGLSFISGATHCATMQAVYGDKSAKEWAHVDLEPGIALKEDFTVSPGEEEEYLWFGMKIEGSNSRVRTMVITWTDDGLETEYPSVLVTLPNGHVMTLREIEAMEQIPIQLTTGNYVSLTSPSSECISAVVTDPEGRVREIEDATAPIRFDALGVHRVDVYSAAESMTRSAGEKLLSLRFNVVDVETGIDGPESGDVEERCVWYDLHGVQVSAPKMGGIYLKRQGDRFVKVVRR